MKIKMFGLFVANFIPQRITPKPQIATITETFLVREGQRNVFRHTGETLRYNDKQHKFDNYICVRCSLESKEILSVPYWMDSHWCRPDLAEKVRSYLERNSSSSL